MELSVVIPIRGATDHLRQQLSALARQEFRGDWEVVIGDNGATDDLGPVLASFAGTLPGLLVVDARDRRGASHARNVAARSSSGDALLFLDADDEVEPGYLATMAAALRDHGVVAARVDHVALNPQWGGKVLHAPWQIDGLTRSPVHPVAAGGTIGVRRAIFDAIGGWNEDLLGAEDDEFCRRIGQAGHPITFVPDAVVRYRSKETIRSHLRQRAMWGYHEAQLLRRDRRHARAQRVRPLPHRRSLGAAARAWARLGVHLVSARSRADVASVFGALGKEVGWVFGRLRRGPVEDRRA